MAATEAGALLRASLLDEGTARNGQTARPRAEPPQVVRIDPGRCSSCRVRSRVTQLAQEHQGHTGPGHRPGVTICARDRRCV